MTDLQTLIDEEGRTGTLSDAVLTLLDAIDVSVPSDSLDAGMVAEALADMKDAVAMPVDELHDVLVDVMDASAALMVAQEITEAQAVSISSLQDVLGSPADLGVAANTDIDPATGKTGEQAMEDAMPTAQTFPENSPAPEAITVDSPQAVAPAPVDSPEAVVSTETTAPAESAEPVADSQSPAEATVVAAVDLLPVAASDAPLASESVDAMAGQPAAETDPKGAQDLQALGGAEIVEDAPVAPDLSSEPVSADSAEAAVAPSPDTDDEAASEQVAASPTGEQEPALNDETGPEIAAPVAVEVPEAVVQPEPSAEQSVAAEATPADSDVGSAPVETLPETSDVQVSDELPATAETQEPVELSLDDKFAGQLTEKDIAPADMATLEASYQAEAAPVAVDETTLDPVPEVKDLTAAELPTPEQSFEPASFPVTDKGF